MKLTFLVMLLSAFLLIFAGCKNSDKAVQTQSPTEAVTTVQTTTNTASATIQQTTTATTITTTVATIQQPPTATTAVTITETTTEDTERKILESICIEWYGENMPFSVIQDEVEYLSETAKTLPDKYSHSVADEDDLIEQARNIWIEGIGSEYIERIESEYIEIQGEPVRYERDVPPYTVEYYDEYDVWYINPNAPSGVTENGEMFATPSMPQYLLIRGEDGKNFMSVNLTGG